MTMRRTNTFNLNPDREEEAILHEWADNCARMYNEINYKRRQSFFRSEFDWNTDEFYHKYKKSVGSATAQQIIRKNTEAWKSFFALLKAYKKGKIEDKPHPPGYWKDRTTGKRILRIFVRNDSYSVGRKYIKLPFGLKIRWRGRNRWEGKPGRLEIVYDALSGRWVCYMPVEVEQPLHQPIGNKVAYVDLGVKCPIVVNVEGETWGYRANSMLADWWYLTKEIARTQEELDKIGRKSSKRMRQLYRKRKRHFRDRINKIVADFVRRCWELGVAEIVCGDLREIRDNAKFSRKSNSLIHNFWSIGYQYRRLREKAEEYGIRVRREDERGSSSECPRCRSRRIVKRGRLFKCVDCKLEAHRDAVGSVNIGLAQGEALSAGVVNGAVTRPLLLSV
ncbi:MAG: RNA-guided endonuclease InsQ/TnpB family protein [Candidatus Methanospirareceae archaeon]